MTPPGRSAPDGAVRALCKRTRWLSTLTANKARDALPRLKVGESERAISFPTRRIIHCPCEAPMVVV